MVVQQPKQHLDGYPWRWAWVLLLLGLPCGVCQAQSAAADTIFLLMNNGKEVPVSHLRNYINPSGTRVRQYRARIGRTQVGHLAYLLHIPGSADSVRSLIQGVSGVHVIWQDAATAQVQDLVTMRHKPTQAVECGQTNLCQPDRLVVDVRLQQAPLAYLWVCQITISDVAK